MLIHSLHASNIRQKSKHSRITTGIKEVKNTDNGLFHENMYIFEQEKTKQGKEKVWVFVCEKCSDNKYIVCGHRSLCY